MNRTKTKTSLFIGGFVLLMLVFTFLDLPISKAVFNIESPFGNFFAAFGETPGVLVGCFCYAALAVTFPPNGNKALGVVNLIGFGLLALGLGAMAGLMPMNYIALPQVAAILLAVVYIALAFACSIALRKKQREALRRAATVGALLLLCAMVIINIIKIFWGRPRMRIMDDPDSQFTLWFIPQGITSDDQFKSFPSGHSANAAVIIWITLLPTFLPKLQSRGAFVALNAVGYGWALLVMFSRIVMGAHFASDVTMGASITVLCFYLLKRAFYKKQDLEQINKTQVA